MLIIGCDFHSRFQQIAMVDTETGELIERRLEHGNGEAKKFYAELQQPVRVGMEATGYAQWFERMMAKLGHDLWVGDAAEIRAAMVAEAEDRFTGRSAHSRSTAHEPVPTDLDSLAGGARCAAAVATSPQAGLLTNFVKESVTGVGHGPRGLPKKEAVGKQWAGRTESSGARSLGAAAPAGVAGDTGPTGFFAG